jgi:hypothetical protein
LAPLKGHEEDRNPPSFLGGYRFFLDVVNKRDTLFPQDCLGQFNISKRPQREFAMFFAKNMASKYSYIANSTQNMIWNNLVEGECKTWWLTFGATMVFFFWVPLVQRHIVSIILSLLIGN